MDEDPFDTPELRRFRMEARLHVLEGMRRATQAAGEVGAVVDGTNTRDEAHSALMTWGLSEVQADHVLDMRLAQRTRAARADVAAEEASLRRQLAELEDPQ